jgi:hypothetical protein
MSPIAKRPLRRHAASAKRDRRLPRQVPLVSIHIDQQDRPFHTQRPIRSNRNLYCRNRHQLCRRLIQYFIRHRTPLISAHWKTLAGKLRIANVGRFLRSGFLGSRSSYIHFHLIDVTPAPLLARLNRSHDRMFRRIEMPRRMSILRRVAASHMTTLQAHPQMHPLAANLQALLATLRRRLYLPYLIQMATFHGNAYLNLILIPRARNFRSQASSESGHLRNSPPSNLRAPL